MKLNNKGFSFVELLAAVAILAILSSIAIVGVTNILNKSHKEYYNNERKNLILAAQAYVNENKSKLPKVVGKKEKIEAEDLKTANYLKKDITTYDGKGTCMDSYVTIFKYGQSDYSYVAYLDCEGEEKDAYKDPDNVSPTFDVYWPGSNQSVALSSVQLTIRGGSEDTPVNLISYSYSISVIEGSGPKELVNSGNRTYRSQVLNKNVSLAKYTIKGTAKMLVKMTATNVNGVTKTQVFLRNFADKTDPTCIIKAADMPNTPEGKKPWVNNQRTITIGCKDQDGAGSGCEKSSYTKTFTRDNIEDYITIKDNAGNSKKCYVTTYIDKTKPKIVATAYKCNSNGNASGAAVGTITAQEDKTWSSSSFTDNVNGWLNKDNYPNGVCFVFEVSDNLAMKDKTWRWNTANQPKNANGYKTLTGGPTSTLDVNKGQYVTKDFLYDYTGTKAYKHSLKAEGHRYAEFYISDDRGNNVTLKMDIKIDRTAPNKPSNNMKKWSNNNTKPDTLAKGQALSHGYTNNTWSQLKVFTWPGAVTDAISGGVYYQYTTTGVTENNKDKQATFRNIAAQGVSHIKWRSYDEAGNTLGYNDERTIKTDWTDPTCSDKHEGGTKGNHGWYTGGTVKGYGICSDQEGLSGCKDTKTLVQTVSSNSPNSGGTKGSKVVYDNAGNSVTCHSTIKYDKSDPGCSIPDHGWTEGSVRITTSCWDNGPSGVDDCEKSYSTSDTGNKRSDVKDNAGNTNSCSTTVSSKRQKSDCSTCSRCNASDCETANTCTNSCCGQKKKWSSSKNCGDSQCCPSGYSSSVGQSCSWNGCENESQDGGCTRAWLCKCAKWVDKECQKEECCGCKTHKRSCPKCGCDSWGGWYDSSCTASNSVRCRTMFKNS